MKSRIYFNKLRPLRRFWQLRLYKVAGSSMLPTLNPGDILLGRRNGAPQIGLIIVALRDGRPLIKRVVRVEGGNIWLAGDNPAASTDSRHFGPLPHESVEAVIITKIGRLL